jgi:hypothetical protein
MQLDGTIWIMIGAIATLLILALMEINNDRRGRF